MQQYSLPSINMLVSHDTGKAHVNLRTRLYTNTLNTFLVLIIIVCLRHNTTFPLCLITIAVTGPIVSIKHQLAQWLALSIQPTNLCVNNSVDLELISLHHLLSITTITHQRHYYFIFAINFSSTVYIDYTFTESTHHNKDIDNDQYNSQESPKTVQARSVTHYPERKERQKVLPTSSCCD